MGPITKRYLQITTCCTPLPSFTEPFDKSGSLNCSLCRHTGISGGRSLSSLSRAILFRFSFLRSCHPSYTVFSFGLSGYGIRLHFPLNLWELCADFRIHVRASPKWSFLGSFNSPCERFPAPSFLHFCFNNQFLVLPPRPELHPGENFLVFLSLPLQNEIISKTRSKVYHMFCF